jgi:hypothetical protein
MADKNVDDKADKSSAESSVDEALIKPEPDPSQVVDLLSDDEDSEEPKPSTSAAASAPSTSAAASAPPPRKKQKRQEDFFCLDGHEVPFHQQDPPPYVNNCPLALFFAWMELMAYSCTFDFKKYKPKQSDTTATLLVNTLTMLLAYFKNLQKSLPLQNPKEKSAFCLKTWFEMRQKINPKWSPPKLNTLINCAGLFEDMIMHPLSEISDFLLRRWCSCAVEMRDQFLVVPFQKCQKFILRYVKIFLMKAKQTS